LVTNTLREAHRLFRAGNTTDSLRLFELLALAGIEEAQVCFAVNEISELFITWCSS
jgi:hypothetical protein